jgi:hypothetical protein
MQMKTISNIPFAFGEWINKSQSGKELVDLAKCYNTFGHLQVGISR